MTDLAVEPAPEPAPDELRDPAASTYRSHLDGLRAVAVFMVLLYHSRIASAAGGFIGVDVFFVLSGFLVTQLLLRDLDRRGGIRLGRFYARRYRRLLPASFVTLLVTAVLFSAVAAPGEAGAALGAFKAAFLYVANWFFLRRSGGYFNAGVATNPTLHFWSLAVEEQFYVVWPLLLGGLYTVVGRGGRERARMRTVVLVAAIASLVWALSLQGGNLDRAYYGTDARAYQLLAGALLALTPGIVTRVRRRGGPIVLIGAAALAGLVVLATSLVSVGPITRGAFTALLAVILITALEAAPLGPVHGVLSSEPFVYLGKISYGIYLWHWPVILVALAVAKPGPWALAGLTALIATGLASASYHLLEMPIRTSEVLHRHRFAVISAGIAISVVSALIFVPAILNRSSTDSSSTTVTAGFTPVPKLHLAQVYKGLFGNTVECSRKAPTACIVVHGRGRRVMLMGDSNAEMFVPAFESLARAQGLTLSLEVTSGCSWQRGIAANAFPSIRPVCERNKEDAYKRVIPALHPDIIVLIDTNYPPALVAPATMADATRASLAQLKAPGRKLVLVDPVVQSPVPPEPLQCLRKAHFIEDCRYIGDTAPTPLSRLYSQLAAADPSLVDANFDRLVCPYLPICDPVIGGVVVRWDHQHISTDYSATLGPALAAYFKADGLIPR